jgi:hypothetical protein
MCHDGFATGRGYGLIMSETGESIEFLGDAQDGVAQGSGGMIVQHGNQLGATYYEGEFKRGLPDGVVRVETAGEPPRLRRYKNGNDVGKGNISALKSLRFASGNTDHLVQMTP